MDFSRKVRCLPEVRRGGANLRRDLKGTLGFLGLSGLQTHRGEGIASLLGLIPCPDSRIDGAARKEMPTAGDVGPSPFPWVLNPSPGLQGGGPPLR